MNPRLSLTPARNLQIEIPFNSSAFFWTGVALIAVAAVMHARSKKLHERQ